MKITEKIHCLKIEFNVGEKISRFVNIYLLFGKKIYIIDSGIKGCIEYINDYIEKNGRKITEIDSIFLTHSHPDHIGSLSDIKKVSNAKIYCSKQEKEWVENIDKQFEEREIPDFYKIVSESSKVDFIIEEEREIKLEDNLTIKFIFTPGHSNGSYSYYLIEEKALFSGDLIPVERDENMPVYSDYNQLINSIKKVEKSLEIKYLCSAWDDVRDGDEAINIIKRALNYLERIDISVRKNYNPEDGILVLAQKVFKECRIENPILVPVTLKSILSHIK